MALPILIFEGPDGSGKTTAIRAVSKRITETVGVPVTTYHHGAYENTKNPFIFYFRSITTGTDLTITALDRSWVSEPIYGRAARGGADRITAEQLEVLETIVSASRGIEIICLPPFKTILEVYRDRSAIEYLGSERALADVYRSYARRLLAPSSRPLVPRILYDRTADGTAKALGGYIIDYINGARL